MYAPVMCFTVASIARGGSRRGGARRWWAVAVAPIMAALFFEEKMHVCDVTLRCCLRCSSEVFSKTSQLRMMSEDAAVNRRSALMTAAGMALSLRNPSAASAANTVTATMSVNTFEGKLLE